MSEIEHSEWIAAMRSGDFERAWRASDAVLRQDGLINRSPDLPRHLQSVWDGRPLAGQRVLVRCYHGLGDTIQFARFLPYLPSSQAIVWAQPELIPLLPKPKYALMLPLHEGTPEIEYDVDIEIMELPHALRTTLATLPADVPYLRWPGPPDERLRQRVRRVGLVAQAGGWNARRSVPAELLATLTAGADFEFVSLQLGVSIPGAIDAQTADLVELAARVAALDLVITPDTMMAHLAGALAVRTWTLLPAEADWRWMTDRDDSPWYPTMRLFRQPRPGDWQSVVGAVRSALNQNVRS